MPTKDTEMFTTGVILCLIALAYCIGNEQYVIAIPAAAIIAVLIVWYVPAQQVLRGGKVANSEYLRRVSEPRKTVVQVVGGVVLVVGLWLTYEQINIDKESAKEKLVTEQFIRAMYLLKDFTSLTARLGGIYALERIAQDSEKDHWTIMEILSADARNYADWLPDSVAPVMSADIQAILTVIGRRKWLETEKKDVNLSKINLKGIRLDRANFEGADFSHANLDSTFLQLVNFERTNLCGARFVGANLLNVKFNNTIAIGSNFEGANLLESKLRYALLYNANLRSSTLFKVNLRNTGLNRVCLKDAYLGNAELRGTWLLSADSLLTAKTLHNANIDDSLRTTMKKLDSARYLELIIHPALTDSLRTAVKKLGTVRIEDITAEQK